MVKRFIASVNHIGGRRQIFCLDNCIARSDNRVQMADSAAAVLRPLRIRILAEAGAPASAVEIARRLGAPRQKVAYHVRALEREGLVECVEERQRGNCTERFVKATARAYLLGADAIARVAADPGAARDRVSSGYLVAVAAQAVRDVALMRSEAEKAGRKLATLTLETEIRFASSARRAAFAEELAGAVSELAAKYHDARAPGGRTHRMVVGVYPAPRPEPTDPTQGADHG